MSELDLEPQSGYPGLYHPLIPCAHFPWATLLTWVQSLAGQFKGGTSLCVLLDPHVGNCVSSWSQRKGVPVAPDQFGLVLCSSEAWEKEELDEDSAPCSKFLPPSLPFQQVA